MANKIFELDMIGLVLEEKLGHMIKLYPLANVKNMEAKAGGTIQVPMTKYIGDATDVEAGVPIPESNFTQEVETCNVKKAAKHIVFTQEEINNAYLDINEIAENQLAKSIANKVEADLFAEVKNGTQKATIATLDVEGLADALIPFGEDLEDAMYLFVNPADLAGLRKDPDFMVNANHGGKIVGSAGMIFGMEVIVTNHVAAKAPVILKEGAVALFVKKAVELEEDKDITNQTYHLVATQHYVAKLVEPKKAIAVTVE